METDSENKEVEKTSYASAQEFIKTMNEKQKKKEQEIKNEILIHLGLIDKEKSDREYFPYWVNEKCKWDEEVEKYYIDKHTPLEVSDEEYKEILKYAQIEGEEEKPKKSTNWGKSIETIIWIILILGIIFNLFLMFNVEKPTGIPIYSEEYELAAEAAEIDRWGYLVNIIFFALSFPFLIGFAKLVSAAEKYLRK
jgi:ATP-dependent Zn protease